MFVATVRAQNALYHALYAKLRPYVFAANPEAAADPGRHALLDGWAKEDARYAVSLATEGQLGLTVNARNLELMIRRFAAKPSAEIQALYRMLAEEARRVAPSIILFTAATPFDAETAAAFRAGGRTRNRNGDRRGRSRSRGPAGEPAVRLPEATPDGDDRILAALLHAAGGRSFDRCRADVRKLSIRKKRALFLSVF